MSDVFFPIVTTAAVTLVTPSAPVPKPDTPAGARVRFTDETLYWVRVTGVVTISAFARATVRVFRGTNAFGAAAWTMFEVTPLVGLDSGVFTKIRGGLPVQYVVVAGAVVVAGNDGDFAVAGGEPLASNMSDAWFAVAFQDRVTRDPALWSAELKEVIGAASAWDPFAAAMTGFALPNLRVLDHVGHPFNGTIGSVVNVVDGDSGLSETSAITYGSEIIAGGVEEEWGEFGALPLTLPSSNRHVQLFDADAWYGTPPAGSTLQRWRAGSSVEPIIDGNPYFARLVQDLRAAKPGGKARLAGWVFLARPEDPWPLIPKDHSTELLKLAAELFNAQCDVRFLVNQLAQLELPATQQALTKASVLVAIAGILSLGLGREPFPTTAGIILGVGAFADWMNSPPAAQTLQDLINVSKSTIDALILIGSGLAISSRNPVLVEDNPLVGAQFVTLPLLGGGNITINEIKHFGVYHQKMVVIESPADGPVAYLGGIDLDYFRIDTPIHRAVAPFHDLQLRITGPAADDVSQTFAERYAFDAPAIPLAPILPAAVTSRTHVVQIARTYPKAATGSLLPFAPQGERLIYDTLLKAIGNAREFIYIEDQYFTPDDGYVDALLGAAAHCKALFITVPVRTDQLFGSVRRNDIFAALHATWGDRMHAGVPMRRFLDPSPKLAGNEGRCVLAAPITATDLTAKLGPKARIADAPFWAFIENELVYFETQTGDVELTMRRSLNTIATSALGENVTGDPTQQYVQSWQATPVAHPKGAPVLLVTLPGIYVHAKMMIVDDVFLSAGSANLTRRSFFSDGELVAFTVPQHLKSDPTNPARRLRCELMAEHLGLPHDAGYALFGDPLAVIPYLDRSWYAGTQWQRIVANQTTLQTIPNFLRPDFQPEIKTATGFFSLAANVLAGAAPEIYRSEFWNGVLDPTTSLDPNPTKGPRYP
ncbi:MAG TPA: phospholipase D-like domain-containing protein [Thermoanaerobaculia bacterium]